MKLKKFFFIFLFLLITVYSLLFSKNQPAGIYKWIKFIEMGLLILYIKHYINIKKRIKNIVKVLSLAVIWQSVLVILQWIKQGNIFGYWFFGEQPFNTATLGIKKINLFGSVKVVPIGTFPHPNVLAGFLVISLLLLLFLHVNPGVDKIRKSQPRGWTIGFLALGIGTGIIALGLTFSYFSWVGFLLGIIFIKIIPVLKSKKILITVYSLLFTLTLVLLGLLIETTSIIRRIELNKIAVKMWLSSPIFGVGLNNFIPRMEEFGRVIANYRFLQPVHNLPLLILSETGIVGLLITSYWLLKLVKMQNAKCKMQNNADEKVEHARQNRHNSKFKNYSLLFTIYSLLFLGLFDHYWLTIQQGMLVVTLILGLLMTDKHNSITKTVNNRNF